MACASAVQHGLMKIVATPRVLRNGKHRLAEPPHRLKEVEVSGIHSTQEPEPYVKRQNRHQPETPSQQAQQSMFANQCTKVSVALSRATPEMKLTSASAKVSPSAEQKLPKGRTPPYHETRKDRPRKQAQEGGGNLPPLANWRTAYRTFREIVASVYRASNPGEVSRNNDSNVSQTSVPCKRKCRPALFPQA